MDPVTRYQTNLKELQLVADESQYRAVEYFQELYRQLQVNRGESAGLLGRLFKRTNSIKGLYLCGSVGRGKTWLMDLFYDCLDFLPARRVHYHRFMLNIHEQLKNLPRSPNPLRIIARKIADHTRVLCLDEFHVNDVTDAMLLDGLLSALIENHVVLVATSNTHINDLYLNGLQRERFMRTIELLQEHTLEIDLEQGADYRLMHLEHGKTYQVQNDEYYTDWIKDKFTELAPTRAEYNQQLEIFNRFIDAMAIADDVVWFDFDAICNTPRAARDYLEISQMFHTVCVSNIPVMGDAEDSEAKRFMHLIDALYDHRVKLIATAHAAPDDLYHGRRLEGDFNRTVSRLIEMGSHDYLALPHRI